MSMLVYVIDEKPFQYSIPPGTVQCCVIHIFMVTVAWLLTF